MSIFEGFFFSPKILSTIFQQSLKVSSFLWKFSAQYSSRALRYRFHEAQSGFFLYTWENDLEVLSQPTKCSDYRCLLSWPTIHIFFFFSSFLFFFFFFLVSVSTLWMSWNFDLGLPQTHRILPLCFLSAGIKLVYHNTFQHTFFIFIVWIKLCLV